MENNKHSDKALWRKLITVIILKLIIILAIWWVFMRPDTPKVDENDVQKHLLSVTYLPQLGAYNSAKNFA